MIAELKPYPEYKESGLPWLGQVPGHWEILAIRRVFRAVTRRDIRGDEVKMSMSRHLGLVPSTMLGARNSTKASSINYSVCHVGDLVMNKYQAHSGLFGCAINRGLITSNYTVFNPNTMARSDFYARLFSSVPFQRAFQLESYGVGDGMSPLYTGVFYRISTLLPPPEEQEAIVRFLDWATGRLDRAIRAKRKIIALLNEKKQVIIQRAVTRGLDPNVPLKPSGIPWLGDIPAHWETPLNQMVFRENIRPHFGNPEQPLSLSQRDGLIATQDMRERSLKTSTFDNWKVVLPGDLVLNRFKAHLGVFFAATLRGIVSFHYGVFAPRVRINVKYYEHLYHTLPYRTIFAGQSNGMTVGLQNLSNQNFYNTRTVIPPFEEQEKIVAFIDNETFGLNSAISLHEREIELLREYRTRLIADVVTGKLDVREAVAKLPNEVIEEVVDELAEEESETDDPEVET